MFVCADNAVAFLPSRLASGGPEGIMESIVRNQSVISLLHDTVQSRVPLSKYSSVGG